MSACPVERNVGFEFALPGLTINLAPAAMPNEGTGFDLTNGVPIPPMDAGVTDHVWKIDESVALLDRR